MGISFEDRAQGVLLGLATGDALGAPAEFKESSEIPRLFDGPLTEMRPGGLYAARAVGEPTDDTEMALALGHAVAEHGFDDESVAHAYYEWMMAGPNEVGLTVRHTLAFDADERRPLAAQLRERAAHYHEINSGKSAGNGTVMRCAPLALACDDPAELERWAIADASLTHHDPLCGEASAWLCQSLDRLLHGYEPLYEAVDERLHAALNCGQRECEKRSWSAPGFVLTAVAIAAYALRDAPDPERGLCWIVNLGEDSDTNAAVAGALLGAKHGASALPERWLKQLTAYDELVKLTGALLRRRATA